MNGEDNDYGFPWLPDEEYTKLKGQVRLQLNGIMSIFSKYGIRDSIPGAIEAILELFDHFGMRVRGEDRPVHLKKNRIHFDD